MNFKIDLRSFVKKYEDKLKNVTSAIPNNLGNKTFEYIKDYIPANQKGSVMELTNDLWDSGIDTFVEKSSEDVQKYIENLGKTTKASTSTLAEMYVKSYDLVYSVAVIKISSKTAILTPSTINSPIIKANQNVTLEL